MTAGRPTQKSVAPDDRVRDLFEGYADLYQERSHAWPWRWIRSWEACAVESMLGPLKGVSALDLGCGAGYYTQLLLNHGVGKITAVDFSAAMVAKLPKKGVTGIVADAVSLRLPETFSLIISAGLLEFVPDPLGVMLTARHHANERTVFVLLAPSCGPLARCYRTFHRMNGLNIRLFSPVDLAELAARSGWRLVRQQTVFPFAQVVRLEASSRL